MFKPTWKIVRMDECWSKWNEVRGVYKKSPSSLSRPIYSGMCVSLYSKSLKWIMLMLLIPTISWLAYSSILMSFLRYKESGFKCMPRELWKLNWLLRKEAKHGIYDLVFLCLETVQAGKREFEWLECLG